MEVRHEHGASAARGAVTGDHAILVRSRLSLPVVMEAAAMFVDALVEGRTVSQRTFVFSFAEGGDGEVVITASLRHPTSENPVRWALTPIYNLMAGFHKAGAAVQVTGMLAGLLPGGGVLTPDPAHAADAASIRQIFEDDRAPDERMQPVDPAILAEVFSVLDGADGFGTLQQDAEFRGVFPDIVKDHRDRHTYYLTHRSGLQFVALVRRGRVYAHGIHAHTPLSARYPHDFFDVRPQPARTWGEIWANASLGGALARPSGLEILPDEIALLHSEQVKRYTVDDRTSLADLTDLRFGPGVSRMYSAQVWLAIGEQYGQRKAYEMARRCAEQALLLHESAEQDATAQQELTRWQDWLDFTRELAAEAEAAASASAVGAGAESATQEPPAAPPRVPVRPLSALLKRLPSACADRLDRVCTDILEEHAEAHDYRRQVQRLGETRLTGRGADRFGLEYRRVTGKTMLDAGVSPGALAHLGYRFRVIPPPAVLDDVFTITCGDDIIWGTVDSQRLLLQRDPRIVYTVIG